MEALAALALWLVPPAALIASYWQIIGATRFSALTRNALAIGTTAALVVLIGFDAIGLYRVGPWSAHPQEEWALRIALGAITAAAFAFPTAWSCGTIFQVLRAKLRQPLASPPAARRTVVLAACTLAALVLAYCLLLVELAALAQRAAALRASDHHPGAPP